MRLALLAAASTLLVGFATFACSGTATNETGKADAGTAVVDPTTTSGTSTATTTGTTTTSDDAGTSDAAVVITATANRDAGVACAADSIHETEPNDTTANVIPAVARSSFCGRLSGADVDKVSFVMPMTIDSFAGDFASIIGLGFIDTVADVNGRKFDFFGRWPFVPGGTYTFTLTGAMLPGAELDYKMSFEFEP